MKKMFSAMLLCSAMVLTAQENLLINGSFEETNAKGALKGWYLFKDAKIVSDAADGKQAVMIKNNRIATAQFNIKPGKYTLKFKAKKAAKAWCGFGFICIDKENKQIKSKTLNAYFGTKEANPQWTQFEFPVEFPENIKGRTYLLISINDKKTDLFVDDVQLIKKDTTSPTPAKK